MWYNKVNIRVYLTESGWAVSKKVSREYVEKNVDVIRTPQFTIKGLQNLIEGLTYRKLNDWDGKGLISGSRENKEEGWRRFSFIDIIKLQLISDLRKFGVDVDKIKTILQNASKTAFSDVTILEKAVFRCLDGELLLLSIDGNSGQISFFTQEKANPYVSIVIILPFFQYTKMLRENLIFEDEKVYDVILSNKEMQVVETIKNNDFRNIDFTGQNKKTYSINPDECNKPGISPQEVIKAVHTNSFSTVSVITTNGSSIVIDNKGD